MLSRAEVKLISNTAFQKLTLYCVFSTSICEGFYTSRGFSGIVFPFSTALHLLFWKMLLFKVTCSAFKVYILISVCFPGIKPTTLSHANQLHERNTQIIYNCKNVLYMTILGTSFHCKCGIILEYFACLCFKES